MSNNKLTDRELEVLQSIVSNGYVQTREGETLVISRHTVKTYINAVFQKLEVTNISDALMKALKLGIIGLHGAPTIKPGNIQEQIDYIMDRFEFGKVQMAMEALDWKWAACEEATKDEMLIPSEVDLRKAARALMNDLQEGWQNSSGGFKACMEKGIVSLTFEIDGVEYEGEERQ